MYTALYRQWRPDSFDDVVGQDPIVRTLKNQIKIGRIGHAYLFCGSRGTGKTSTAKIFAKAINCMDPIDSSPCEKCVVCTRMASDSLMDIFEIDAASNNGVDEIRELRDKVRYPPNIGKYKVYIIDEVHMLSTSAFNALLKTLEEPPSHVVFILATTEPHKLPATILSRCQRYDFKRISLKVIVDRMKTICQQTGVKVEEEGLFTIARWAEGGMRDALSLLDQCIGFCGNEFTNDDILTILGTADQGFLFEMADHIINGDAQQLLLKIDKVVDDGKDLSIFAKNLVDHIRNLIVVKLCENPESMLDIADSTYKRLKEQSDAAGHSRLVRALEVLSALEINMRNKPQQRLLFEMAVIKLCMPSHEKASIEVLIDRIEVLEKKLAEGVFVMNNRNDKTEPYTQDGLDQPQFYEDARNENQNKIINKPKVDNSNKVTDSAKQQIVNKDSEKPVSDAKDNKDVISVWSDIVKKIKKERLPIYMIVKDGKPSYNNSGVLTLSFPPENTFNAEAVEKESNRVFIEEVIKGVTGNDIRLKCSLSNVGSSTGKSEDIVVDKAYELFGKEFVEVIEDE